MVLTRIESVISNKKMDLELNVQAEDVLIMFIGFFISRVSILDKLTPFGIAFLGSYMLIKGANLYLLFSIIFGSFTLLGFQGMDYYIALLLIYVIITKTKEGKKYTLIKSSLIFTLFFSTFRILLMLTISNYYMYDLFILLFEGVLIFTMTYIFSFSLPIEDMKGKNISNEKLVCSFITLALVLSGFNNIDFLGMAIKNIITPALVIYLSYTQGVLIGTSVGVILGLVSYMSSPEMPFIISILGVGALLSGIFRDLGKFGSILGFILGNGIISFYINNLGTSFLNYKELALSSLAFLIVSKHIDIDIKEMILGSSEIEKTYIQKKDDMAVKKLDNMVRLLDSLSQVFKRSIDENDMYSTVEVYNLIDDVCNKSCRSCQEYNNCWEEDYYGTYQKIFNIIGIIESETFNVEECAPKIEEFCKNSDHLICNIVRYYEDFEKDYIWNQRLIEQRRLLAEQLDSIGKVVEEITEDIYCNPIFNEELEGLILKELKNERTNISSLTVAEMPREELEIIIDLNNKETTMNHVENIKSIVSKNLGFPLSSDFVFGNTKENKKMLKLTRSSRFASLTKVSSESNSENRVSGDNYTYGEIDGTAFLAISDGMGIGKKANVESSIAIELFEKLMETNMNKNMIIKTINSVLRAKSDDEIFATLDLGFIDLYTGKLQILKTGAPATFIKKKDRVEIINSRSLPIGILEDVEFNIYEENLEDGDIVIMMSDGILDSNRDIENQEIWMQNLIMNINSQNPSAISEEILSIARFVSGNNSTDDMTVMATKVWKST